MGEGGGKEFPKTEKRRKDLDVEQIRRKNKSAGGLGSQQKEEGNDSDTWAMNTDKSQKKCYVETEA